VIPIANPLLTDAEVDSVAEVLRSGMLADGPRVRSFEAQFAEYCNASHGIATSNGTTALHAALEAAGIEAGDKVVTSSFSFVASANAIRLAGGEPVFADIDPTTFNLDPDHVRELVSEDDDITGILAVHLYGLPCDIERLTEIADQHDLLLIEDAAQAHGASYLDSPVGTFGDLGCFSFYPTKNMTTGEGGMVVTDRADLAERVSSFVNHGRNPNAAYEHTAVGHNFRLNSIAAAIGQHQLEKLPGFVEERRANAQRLTDLLEESDVRVPKEPDGRRHSYHQYTIRYHDRDGLAEYLESHDIGTGVYYPHTIPDQQAYDDVDAEVPHARRAADDVLSLPVHPAVSETDIEKIAMRVREYTET